MGSKTLVIRNGNLIDGSGKPTARNEAIVIEGNRIKSVGPRSSAVPAGAKVVDASNLTAMPGLIEFQCSSNLAQGSKTIYRKVN